MHLTGKKPIGVRWVDTNKGDVVNHDYRSRLVARDIRKPGEDPSFAPTPSFVAIRMVLSAAATEIANAAGKQFKGPGAPPGGPPNGPGGPPEGEEAMIDYMIGVAPVAPRGEERALDLVGREYSRERLRRG